MFKVGSVFLEMTVKSDKMVKGMKEASKQLNGLKPNMAAAEEGSKKLAKGIALVGVAAGAAAVVFAKKSLTAYREQAKVEAKLIQLHQENTGATKEQTQSLLDLASQVQKNGVIGDEAIINGQAQLSTFKLSTEAIASLTPAMADMVAQQKGVNATGDDFVNVGNLMGKVMEGNIGALSRYGVSFDANSEAILKNGTEAEKAAELAKVLEANYGGVNEALAQTDEGKIQNLKNRFGDLQEKLGELVSKVLVRVADWFEKIVSKIEDAGGFLEWFRDIIARNEQALIMVASAITAALVPALVAWGRQAKKAALANLKMMLPLLPFIVIGAAIGAVIYMVVQRMGGWQKTMEKLQPVFDKVKEFASKAFEVIRQAVDILKKKWDEAWPAIERALVIVWEQVIQPIFAELVAWIQDVIVPVVMLLWEIFQTVWPAIQNILVMAWNIIKPILAVLAWVLVYVVVPAFLILSAIIRTVISAIVAVITWAWNNVIKPVWDVLVWYVSNVLVPQFNFLWTIVKFVFDKIMEGISSAWDVIKPIWDAIWKFISDTLIPAFKGIWATVKDVFDRVKNWIQIRFELVKFIFDRVKGWITDLIDKFKEILQSIKNALRNVKDAITKPFKEAFDWIKDKVDDVKDALKKLVPSMPFSPPLTLQISRGTEQIKKSYGDMFDYIGQGAGLSRSGLQMATGAGGFATELPIAKQGNSLNIEVHMDGVWTSSRADRRALGLDMIDAVNDELTRRGLEPLGGGYLKGDNDG